MDNDQLREKVTSDIMANYRDLNSPDFHWVQPKYLSNPYKDTISKIVKIGFDVIEETDLNEDVSVNLFLRKDDINYFLRLSLIGRYAIIFRHDREYGDRVVSQIDIRDTPMLQSLAEILVDDAINIIEQPIAETPIRLNLFNTDMDKATFYNALFSDEPFPGKTGFQ
ncbi:hypothetical protein [Acidiphilium sp.]|uniref:hypothetical protein n=1 Tax=Acidiphilium sp. TaxID=527 RepID=UPI003D02FE7A